VLCEALGKASVLLASPGCGSLADEFADRDGRPLSNRLNALGVDIQTYLTFVVFTDTSRRQACTARVLGFTSPGNRMVNVCSEELKRAWQQYPEHTVAALIHEMLHTLGLGENPPSTHEITRGVLDRCKAP